MDRVTMLRFEKLKYFRSLPSCAWQSAHRASIRGLFGRLLATSGACCQSSFPATIEAVSPQEVVEEDPESWKAPLGATASILAGKEPWPHAPLVASTRPTSPL